jgi:hypothetical protein
MTQDHRHAALTFAAAVLLGCPPAPAVGPAVPGGGLGELGGTFSSISAAIFVPRCATSACHTGSPPANGIPVSLDAELAWVELVGVQAIGAPSIALVEPGDPQASYLVHKLRGTGSQVGGTDLFMPPDGQLDEAEILAIEGWIANGAPND